MPDPHAGAPRPARAARTRPARAALPAQGKGAALLTVGAHVGALLFDHFVGFGIVDVLVPYATRYRPGALAWGIVWGLLSIALVAMTLRRILASGRADNTAAAV